ncbi:hypothetical protein R6Z07M_007808 [Ovis aries]
MSRRTQMLPSLSLPLAHCLVMRGHRFDPWFRKIPRAMGQLSLCATTPEPWHSRAMLPNKRSHTNEKSTCHN